MDTQQLKFTVSEWEEPTTFIKNQILDTEQALRPEVEVAIDGSRLFRRILEVLEAATLFDWIETEVEKAITERSLDRKHNIQLEYQVEGEVISKRGYDRDSFDKALQEALVSSSICIKITASLALPQSARSREKGYQILTQHIIERTTGKYRVPKTALDEFRNEELLNGICAEDSALRKLQIDHPSFLKDLQRGRTCGVKLLAIFILAQVSDLGSTFRDFWECELLDYRLPFVRSNKPTFCEKQFWLSICDTQWQVLPIELAQLGPGEIPAKFDKDRCLSFEEADRPLGKGGFGVVVEIQLDTDHPILYVAEDQYVSLTERLHCSSFLIADGVLGYASSQPAFGS